MALLSSLDNRVDVVLPLAEQPEVLTNFSLCLLVLESDEDQSAVNHFSNTYFGKLIGCLAFKSISNNVMLLQKFSLLDFQLNKLDTHLSFFRLLELF